MKSLTNWKVATFKNTIYEVFSFSNRNIARYYKMNNLSIFVFHSEFTCHNIDSVSKRLDDKLKWNPLNVRSSIIVIVYKRLKAIFVISSLNTVFATSSYFLTHSLSLQSLQPKFLFQLFLFSWHDIPVTCQLTHTCFK